MSRALVALAERGVRAEAEATEQLKASYRRFLAENAPAGDWHKDFGSFTLRGTGQFPKTVQEKGMKPFGHPIS